MHGILGNVQQDRPSTTYSSPEEMFQDGWWVD